MEIEFKPTIKQIQYAQCIFDFDKFHSQQSICDTIKVSRMTVSRWYKDNKFVEWLSKQVNYDFESAIDKVTEELQKEGFGILTEIDVKATMKKKLDVDFPNYKILGACNPSLAHKALSAETEIGL